MNKIVERIAEQAVAITAVAAVVIGATYLVHDLDPAPIGPHRLIFPTMMSQNYIACETPEFPPQRLTGGKPDHNALMDRGIERMYEITGGATDQSGQIVTDGLDARQIDSLRAVIAADPELRKINSLLNR